LLLAAHNPSANRSLIAFPARSRFAHAALMGVQAFRNLIPQGSQGGVREAEVSLPMVFE
jgi:hypothetical protein